MNAGAKKLRLKAKTGEGQNALAPDYEPLIGGKWPGQLYWP